MLIVKCSADRVAPEKAVHLEPPFCTIISRDTTRGIEMKYIPLTQGKFAIVDGENFNQLSKYKWHIVKARNTFYAARAINHKTSNGKYKCETIYMHRFILGAKKGQHTDHKNHNGLDNRCCNIRLCTHRQNQYNRKLIKIPTSSKYKGISWKKRDRKWEARIGFNYKTIFLGCYDNEIEAAKAYDKKAKELFGEFAYLNFIERCEK